VTGAGTAAFLGVAVRAVLAFRRSILPSFLVPAQWSNLISHPVNWAPGVISITLAVSLALALSLRANRLRPAAVMVLALIFEVVSSYGIAAAEFLHPNGLYAGPSWIGLSWVSVWMLLFNVVVLTLPRYGVIAALASVSSVPAMVCSRSRCSRRCPARTA
jgi:hypothetical protein